MKSFEELFNEFNNDEEIKEIGQEVVNEVKKRNKITTVLCLIFSAIVIYFLYKYQMSAFVKEIHSKMFIVPVIMGIVIPTMMVNIFIMVIIAIIYSKKYRKFLPVFKEKVIKKMIDNFLDDIEYFPDKKISQRFYKEAKYSGSYDNYYSDDYIEAKIDKKYFIDMAEVRTERIEHDTDSNGNTTTRRVTVFHGLFAKIIIDKSIKSNLRIASNHSGYKNRLEMDSSEFEKNFDVFASDKIIGMQLLTADIMDEILEFKNKTKDEFDIYIDEDKIYLRFHCGSLFEPHFKRKNILDEKSLKLYYDILNFTFELTNKIIKVINDVEI